MGRLCVRNSSCYIDILSNWVRVGVEAVYKLGLSIFWKPTYKVLPLRLSGRVRQKNEKQKDEDPGFAPRFT
jgi:hypothetical protein